MTPSAANYLNADHRSERNFFEATGTAVFLLSSVVLDLVMSVVSPTIHSKGISFRKPDTALWQRQFCFLLVGLPL
jgi:hypothetical protein